MTPSVREAMHILLSTRNRHKASEIQALLPAGFALKTLLDFPGFPSVVEDATTFEGNASKKALALWAWLGARPGGHSLPSQQNDFPILIMADDSGLEVDALNGAPGVHSARFAALDSGMAGNSSDAENNAKLLRLLQSVPARKRTARFRCVIAALPFWEESNPREAAGRSGPAAISSPVRYFVGACEGLLGCEERGKNGFGYDPLFIPTGYRQTFAELGDEIKNQLSHRAQALRSFLDWLSHLK